MYGWLIKRESRLYRPVPKPSLENTSSWEIETNNLMIICLFPSSMKKSNKSIANRKYIENEAVASTVVFRVQSAVGCMGNVYLENSSDLRFSCPRFQLVKCIQLVCISLRYISDFYFNLAVITQFILLNNNVKATSEYKINKIPEEILNALNYRNKYSEILRLP